MKLDYVNFYISLTIHSKVTVHLQILLQKLFNKKKKFFSFFNLKSDLQILINIQIADEIGGELENLKIVSTVS